MKAITESFLRYECRGGAVQDKEWGQEEVDNNGCIESEYMHTSVEMS